MATKHKAPIRGEERKHEIIEDDEKEEDESEDWNDWGEESSESESSFVCLFCDLKYDSCSEVFEHCRLVHKFDFEGIRKALALDFYSSFKLINYIRSQVAENRCWLCGLACQSSEDLQKHSHEAVNFEDIKHLWDDDKYLKPFLLEDPLLYSFGEDEEYENDEPASVDREMVMRDLRNSDLACDTEDVSVDQNSVFSCVDFKEKQKIEVDSVSTGYVSRETSATLPMINVESSRKYISSFDGEPERECSKALHNRAGTNIKKVNEDYFGSYSSFGIHREMLGDKVRMEAYRRAILRNPYLFTDAVVMDVGCGTGILSLFAAQAGASRVIAIEASEKMASVATHIVKENGFWQNDNQNNQQRGTVEVVQCMVEELDKSVRIAPHSVDVLVSEWMGYCLLYESMLSSVLCAREKWLKPGGAILPDMATMYAAGFGRGATSLPFWEDIYGFKMSCVGKELVQEASRVPIVDIVDEGDLVTDSVVLETFDLVTMKPDEVDFTASIELQPKPFVSSNSTESTYMPIWCYGIVLWFDTSFTRRFCKEMPANLSTSPHTPATHWSQTILTFREPIALASGKLSTKESDIVGTEARPASRLALRISIVRASEHRSIDISLETTGFDPDGRKHCLPVQIFNMP